MRVASRASRVSSAALLVGAAFLFAACGEKEAPRDTAAEASTGQAAPGWWGDTAEAVFPNRGPRAFGATWNEVTGALGQPGFLQLESEGEDTTFLAGYRSWHPGISDSTVPLMFEFHSTRAGVRKLARVHWKLRDNEGQRTLPDADDKVRDLVEYLKTRWGDTPAAVEAALGPALPDTAAEAHSHEAGEAPGEEDEGHSPYPTRRYPGLEFVFLEEGTLFGVTLTDSGLRLPHGLRLGMTRHEVLRLMGLPWLAHNDPRGVQRDGPETHAGSAARKEHGDSTVTWQYVPSETDDYFSIGMLRDTVREISWWEPLNH